MTDMNMDFGGVDEEGLPSFSLELRPAQASAIYSDTDMQALLIEGLHRRQIPVFDFEDGLYERLTVADNIAFYRKWFGFEVTLPELLVLFELQGCAERPLRKCSESELRRVHYAKAYIRSADLMVFREPVQGVDVLTIRVFLRLLGKIKERPAAALLLLSNLEHALLLGDLSYKLQPSALRPIETDEEAAALSDADKTDVPASARLFRIPAKVDDKMILFDPPEIDYIESQDGKAAIIVDGETYMMDCTLAEIEKKLELYGFYRCHRSYIVNLQKVREIITWSKNAYSLRIDNKQQSTIPLSRSKIQDIQERFSLE